MKMNLIGTQLERMCFNKPWGPFLYIYLYLRRINSLIGCIHWREIPSPLCILCTLMPQRMPPLTLVLVQTCYEESNPWGLCLMNWWTIEVFVSLNMKRNGMGERIGWFVGNELLVVMCPMRLCYSWLTISVPSQLPTLRFTKSKYTHFINTCLIL